MSLELAKNEIVPDAYNKKCYQRGLRLLFKSLDPAADSPEEVLNVVKAMICATDNPNMNAYMTELLAKAIKDFKNNQYNENK